MSFESLNLPASLLRALSAAGFTSPTPIQAEAIPVALAGRDLMASAQTGTGKTAAFVLPALARLADGDRAAGPQLLILCPTRELALQVEEAVRQFGRYQRVTSGVLVGGAPYGPQIRMLRQAPQVLVATPGRLLDHLQQGRVSLGAVEILVLDEADRMLDMGFYDAVQNIAANTPAERQTLLFSATLEGKVLQVARRLQRDPVRIQLAQNTQRHESIAQKWLAADDRSHKRRLLAHVLSDETLTQAVIFTATKRGADDLAAALAADGHASAPLHGDMGQSARKRTVDHMRRGGFRVLVATDVAARGLDIQGISHVINFDLPMSAEDYVHRIGRTGRGGAEGVAISFVAPEDRGKMMGIERLLGERLSCEVIPGLEPRTPLYAGKPSAPPQHARPGGRSGYRSAANGSRSGYRGSRG